jgi:CO/xanthine dehydrogenase FAD-binding subunit
VQAESFFTGPKKTVLAAGELLVEIRIDARRVQGSSAFRMIGKRNGQAISQVNAAVWLLLEGASVREARVAVGSVAPIPLRLRKTEALLAGTSRGTLDMAEVCACVDSEISPLSDVRASVEYRRLVTRSLFSDCLTEAWKSTEYGGGGA